jgi:hypothetical protein
MYDRIVLAQPPAEEAANFLFKQYTLCDQRKLPVLRPYWIVNYTCGSAETVLVDGCFGTVAGHPDSEEAGRLFRYRDTPLVAAETPALKVISSRCPVCGADTDWRKSEKIHFCRNCGRALILRAGEIIVQPYRIAEPAANSVLLPFWRFHLRLKHKSREYQDLGAYFKLFFAERLLKQRPYGDFISIPAFPIRLMKKGDQLLADLIVSASTIGPNLVEGPLQPFTEITSGLVDAAGAREMIACSLPSAAGVVPGLYKSGNLIEILKETSVQPGEAQLVVIPFPVKNENLIANAKPYSLALLDVE